MNQQSKKHQANRGEKSLPSEMGNSKGHSTTESSIMSNVTMMAKKIDDDERHLIKNLHNTNRMHRMNE